jgi:ferredoxin-type protein NapH
MTWHGVSMSDLSSLVVFLLFVCVIAAMSFASGKRSFCHYGCWMAPFMVLRHQAAEKARVEGASSGGQGG